jgi:hypothetical protein
MAVNINGHSSVLQLVLAIETEQQLDEMEKQQQAQLQQQRQVRNM